MIDNPTSGSALASLLAFWADAGVDTAYADVAIDRLAGSPRRARPSVRVEPPRSPPPAHENAGGGTERVDEARRAAFESADLVALEAAAQAFFGASGVGASGFGASGRTVVFGRGAVDAAVVVIGGAPGAEDEAEGRAFSGAAGRLLDRMLAAAGLEGRAYLANTVFTRTDDGPSSENAALSAPFLQRAIALTRPQSLLLLGEDSARTLLKQAGGIIGLRGRWFDWRSDDGSVLPALATFHPEFLLRQPAAKARAWGDLLTLAARVDRLGHAP